MHGRPMTDERITESAAAASAGQAANLAAGEEPAKGREMAALGIGIAAWVLPGLGHALQKMWARAAGCFLTVGLLVLLGVGMRGNIFTADGSDAFAMLGYFADLGAGSFYLAARSLQPEGPDVAHAEGDDGTRFLAAAGVLNLLAALHAYEAWRGRKA